MRRWRPFPVVLALLAGCSTSPSEEAPLEESPDAVSAQEAKPWEPCGSVASLLMDIVPGATGSEPREMVHGEQSLLFTVDRGSGRELWKSHGPEKAGTALVKQFPQGSTGLEPAELIRVGHRIFFTAGNLKSGRELWVSDGTAGNTRLVKDIWPGETGSFPRSLFEFNGLLYFAASDPVHGRELWRSDGTAAGTFMVEDLEPGPEGTSPHALTRGGDGSLYFLTLVADTFKVLMRSNGGPGAVEVHRVPAEGGILEGMVPVGKRLFFLAGGDHDATVKLQVTDGGAPTHVGMFQEVSEMVAMSGRLYFTATTEDEPGGGELWRSDGTEKGTVRVKDIRPGPEGSSPSHLRVMGRRLFFVADDGASGREPWVSNGTASGTVLLADVEPGQAGSSPKDLAVIQGKVFFSAETAGHGREPWMSDGTHKGTVALAELAPGAASSNPKGFVRSGWDVFFTAKDGAHGQEVWALPFQPLGRCAPRSPR